ncbi:MAG: hypothetical protein ACAH83_07550 [Alphaproteobacteria bacterium]
MSAASTAAIAFNMMSEDNNRRDREAHHRALQADEAKHVTDLLKKRMEVFRKASKRQPPKAQPKTSDEIDAEVFAALPAKNGVIRVF